MSVVGTVCKSLFFNIFTHIFAYFPHFTICSCGRTNKKSVFQVETKITNTKAIKTMLTECIAPMSSGSSHTGVITCRVKGKWFIALKMNFKFYQRLTLHEITPIWLEKPIQHIQ